jgi:hypothetical protein
MKKSAMAFLGLLCVASVVSPASAGLNTNTTVTVSSTMAYGAIGPARRSSDSTEYIGCLLAASAGTSNSASIECLASDAAGNTKACVTTAAASPAIAQVLSTMTSGAFIEFGVDGSNNCSLLYVWTDSRYAAPN